MTHPAPEPIIAWPEGAMVKAESEVGYHVRIAMRAYACAVATEMIAEIRGSRGAKPFTQLLEAKIGELRRLNYIDRLQHAQEDLT